MIVELFKMVSLPAGVASEWVELLVIVELFPVSYVILIFVFSYRFKKTKLCCGLTCKFLQLDVLNFDMFLVAFSSLHLNSGTGLGYKFLQLDKSELMW